MTKTTSILSTSLLLMAIPLAAQDAGLFPKDLGNNFKNPTLTRPAIQSNSRQIGSTQRSSIRSSKQYGNSQQARTFQSYPVPHTFVNQSLTTVDQAKAQKVQNQLRAKLIEYKSAKDDDTKKDISKQVRKLLADQFEIRLKTPSRLIEAPVFRRRTRVDSLGFY